MPTYPHRFHRGDVNGYSHAALGHIPIEVDEVLRRLEDLVGGVCCVDALCDMGRAFLRGSPLVPRLSDTEIATLEAWLAKHPRRPPEFTGFAD